MTKISTDEHFSQLVDCCDAILDEAHNVASIKHKDQIPEGYWSMETLMPEFLDSILALIEEVLDEKSEGVRNENDRK